MKKFLRRIWSRYSKLGKRRKKKQVWRRPTGRDNKMREKRKGYPSIVEKGYRKEKKIRGLIENKNLKLIYRVSDLEKIGKNEIPILGKVGKKRKIEIIKIAKEKKIEFFNINSKKFIKRIEREKRK